MNTNDEKASIMSGKRMSFLRRFSNTPYSDEKIEALIVACWEQDFKDRPSSDQISEKLKVLQKK